MGPHIIIIGGGLAGLSSGCYARASGFRTTIVEHNAELGGVCTAWERGPYLVDGCIHWLTGGPHFTRIYQELGILPKVPLHVLETFWVYRDERDGFELPVTRDLDAFGRALEALAPEDAEEIWRIVRGARDLAELNPHADLPRELTTTAQSVAQLWGMRHEMSTVLHFRSSGSEWIHRHLKNPRLSRILSWLAPGEAPMLFLLMVLGYLERGYLSRPIGGTARFRDALIETYRGLGGELRLSSTVEEVLVRDNCAHGVRLADGQELHGDVVVSTASAPETVFRMLGGHYGAAELRHRLDEWKTFDPIVLATFGVERSLAEFPSTWLIDGIEPFTLGNQAIDRLYLRLYNDDPSFAPAGHGVIQAMLPASYEWWATRGHAYAQDKERYAETLLAQLERHIPGLKAAVRMTDIATPLTYWNLARSWKGAFEGWEPNTESFFGHVKKTLPGLDKFYMAGQWVEPGGGVPTALMSGRQVVQLICADEERTFDNVCTRLL